MLTLLTPATGARGIAKAAVDKIHPVFVIANPSAQTWVESVTALTKPLQRFERG